MGLVVQAGTTYLVLIVAGRTLGPVGFGALSGLYILLTSVATGLFQPLEQEVTRRRGHEWAGTTWDDTLLRRAVLQGLTAAGLAVVVALAAFPATLRILGGEVSLVIALVVALPGYACWFAVRGELAGHAQLARYGAQLIVDGSFRLAGVGALAALDSASTATYGALFALSPWVALALTTVGWQRPHEGRSTLRTAPLTGPLYLLITSALAAQLLINAGPLVVSLLAGDDAREETGVFLAALVIIRVPVFVFTAIQPSFLPTLAAQVAAGTLRPFLRLLATVVVVLTALVVVTCAGATALGPPVVSFLFDFDQGLDRTTWFLLTAAVGLFLLATVLAQALLAVGRHANVAVAWLLGLVGLAAGTAPGSNVIDRATHGLIAGALTAMVVMAAFLTHACLTWSRRTPLTDSLAVAQTGGSTPDGRMSSMTSTPPAETPTEDGAHVEKEPKHTLRDADTSAEARYTVPFGRFALVTGLLALAVGGATALAQRLGSQWFADDFLYLQIARAGSLTPSWLVVDNYGHFAPLTRVAYLLVQRSVGLDYGAALLFPSAIVIVVFLSLVWLFRELLGRRWLVLALALIGATSAPLIRTALWWGAAVHVLGAAALMTLCIAAFVAHARRGHERYRILSVLALVGGLLVQERPMLTIGYLVLLRYLFGIGWDRHRTLRQHVRTEIALWLPWFIVVVVYTVYRIFIFPSAPQPGDSSQAVNLIYQSFFRGWAPSMVGVRAPVGSPVITVDAVVGLVAVAAVSAALVYYRRGAWKVLVFFVAVYVVNMGIVAAGRLSVADVAITAADLQYYVDVHIATVLAFVLGFTVLPHRVRGEHAGAAPARTAVRRGVVGVATLALAVTTGLTWRATIDGNNQTVAHTYFNNAQPELRDADGRYDLVRTKLPPDVAPVFVEPYTDLPAVMALDRDIAPHLDPSADRRITLTSTGDVVEVHPDTIFDLDLDKTTVSAPDQGVDYTEDGACVEGGAGSYLRIPLPEAVEGEGLFYGYTYDSRAQRQARGVLVKANDEPQYNWALTTMPPGMKRTVVDRLDGDGGVDLVLAFEPRARSRTCVSSLWVGRLAAEIDGQCSVLDDYSRPVSPSTDCGDPWPS